MEQHTETIEHKNSKLTKSFNINSIESILKRTLTAESSDAEEIGLSQLKDILRKQINQTTWYTDRLGEFLETQLDKSLTQEIDKLKKIREFSKTSFHKEIESVSNDFISVIFFTPDTIRVLYSPQDSIPSGFINEGIDRHCQIIRSTCRNITRKHTAGFSSFSIDVQDLEEELWSCVMEELVRTMTDMSVRLWSIDKKEALIFPPLESRGRRKGFLSRAAIREDGTAIAAVRSDNTLLVWDTENQNLLQSWDYSLVSSEGEDLTPHRLFFSQDGNRLALEFLQKFIYVFQLGDGSLPIERYEEKSKDRFLSEFGIPYIPQRSTIEKKINLFPVTPGYNLAMTDYQQQVFDSAWDKKGLKLVTASERERDVPPWMVDAGFEKAVHHIAKMRLIDLIRKHTHTDYACWRCGNTNANRLETQCPECGADFTRCPIECQSSQSIVLGPENEWKCPHCGLATRIIQSQKEVDESQLQLFSAPAQHEWASQHDLDRILHALRHINIAYRGRQIPCPNLVLLKSQGKTNEEIGKEIGIPRGSVDYIWNQCRREVLELLKDV